MSEQTGQDANSREMSFDLMRGLLVVLMVWAHVIIFTSSPENTVLRAMSNFADLIVFTGLLFVSGGSMYLGYLKGFGGEDDNKVRTEVKVIDEMQKKKRAKIFARAWKILIAFYVISILGNFRELRMDNLGELAGQIGQILILQKMGSYSEFLIPFVAYSLLVAVLGRFIYRLVGRKWALAITCVVLGVLGLLGGSVTISGPFGAYWALFFGSEGLYRFPLMQYLPVFLSGMAYAKYFGEKDRQVKGLFAAAAGGGLIILALAAGIAAADTSTLWHRWPPSLGFLALGLGIDAFILAFLYVERISRNSLVQRLLLWPGKSAFLIYFVHIVILYIYRYFLDWKTPETLPPVLIFGIIWGLITVICIGAKIIFEKSNKI